MFFRVVASYAIWGWLWRQVAWLLILSPGPLLVLVAHAVDISLGGFIMFMCGLLWSTLGTIIWCVVGLSGGVDPWVLVRKAQSDIVADYRRRAQRIMDEDARREAQAGDLSSVEVCDE